MRTSRPRRLRILSASHACAAFADSSLGDVEPTIDASRRCRTGREKQGIERLIRNVVAERDAPDTRLLESRSVGLRHCANEQPGVRAKEWVCNQGTVIPQIELPDACGSESSFSERLRLRFYSAIANNEGDK